jgi:hypothetical protein
MSTAKVITILHPSSATNNIVNDASGNVAIGNNLTVAGTVAMGSSFKRNRIINGNMMIDQRNAGASVTPTVDPTYCIDRFYVGFSQASKLTVQQQSSVVPVGFSNAMKVTVAAAVTPAAGDYFLIGTNIEGVNCADLNFGSANAATVTLSFQVYSSVSGSYSGAVKNSAQDRSYPFSFSIPTANTWTQISVTISGDTTGTWLKTNGIGITAQICLGLGTTYAGTAGSWVGSNKVGVTGTTNFISTSGATFYITGVQLEVGTVATPYEMQIYSDQLAQCQRYYEFGTGIVSNSGTYGVSYFKITKRTTPTIVVSGYGGSITAGPGTDTSNMNVLINTTTGYTFTASAEL